MAHRMIPSLQKYVIGLERYLALKSCLKTHMSGVRLCGNVGLGKGGSLLLITQVHSKLPKSEQ